MQQGDFCGLCRETIEDFWAGIMDEKVETGGDRGFEGGCNSILDDTCMNKYWEALTLGERSLDLLANVHFVITSKLMVSIAPGDVLLQVVNLSTCSVLR